MHGVPETSLHKPYPRSECPDQALEAWCLPHLSEGGRRTRLATFEGAVVGTIATVQTFLTPAQVDQLVDDYLGGASVTDLAVRYEVHRATVSRHLTDNGVVRRSAGLHGWEAAEAVRLFRQGESLRGSSRSIGASRDSVRRTLERCNEIPILIGK